MMEFRGFRWPQNPASLSVSHGRQIAAHTVPYAGDMLQDFGRRKTVVTGEGVFKGGHAMEQFQQLQAFQEDGMAGVLYMMGLPPIPAKLVELELIGKFTPDKIGYRFVFWEDRTVSMPAASVQPAGGVYTAQAGDNLWQIANQYNTTVERLLELNPTIQWPGYLPAGWQVVLP